MHRAYFNTRVSVFAGTACIEAKSNLRGLERRAVVNLQHSRCVAASVFHHPASLPADSVLHVQAAYSDT